MPRGLTGMLSFAAIPLLDPALPPIIAALPDVRAGGGVRGRR